MKLAIVGSRDFTSNKVNLELMDQIVRSQLSVVSLSKIVSGGARGADKLAEQFAAQNKIELSVHLPDANDKTKSRYAVRNKKIVEECDCVFVFWDGQSRGSAMTLQMARAADKKCFVYNYKIDSMEIFGYSKPNRAASGKKRRMSQTDLQNFFCAPKTDTTGSKPEASAPIFAKKTLTMQACDEPSPKKSKQ